VSNNAQKMSWRFVVTLTLILGHIYCQDEDVQPDQSMKFYDFLLFFRFFVCETRF